MLIEAEFALTQLSTSPSFVKNSSFSKDAEIAQKVIEFATNGLSLSEAFAAQRGIDSTTSSLKLSHLSSLTNAVQQNSANTDFDGYFVAANGQTFAPSMNLRDIPAVAPRGGTRNNETLIYINGISTTRMRQADSLQAIADTTGSRTIGLHNATQGGLLDIAQSFGDKLDVGNNPAVNTLTETVYNELRAGREVHLFAHSQGTIITSRALQDVSNRLRLEDSLSKQDTENLLARVKVETFGGAAQRYPDGPKYVHYINRKDLVPQLFGLREFLNPFRHQGGNAITQYFNAGDGFLAHGLEDIYLCERGSFEQTHLNNFNH
ncbi:MAG: hypothetical protein ABI954_05475 [Pyrinomonadaceae bacterium]